MKKETLASYIYSFVDLIKNESLHLRKAYKGKISTVQEDVDNLLTEIKSLCIYYKVGLTTGGGISSEDSLRNISNDLDGHLLSYKKLRNLINKPMTEKEKRIIRGTLLPELLNYKIILTKIQKKITTIPGYHELLTENIQKVKQEAELTLKEIDSFIQVAKTWRLPL